MPRTPPSGADAELINALAARGVTVSAYQLERWRTAGLLPRNPRRGLGQGRGSGAVLLPETVTQAEMLARGVRQGCATAKTLIGGGIGQAFGTASVVELRAVISGHLRRMAEEGGAATGADLTSEEHDERAEEALVAVGRDARRSPPEMHNGLLDMAGDLGFDVSGIPRMPPWSKLRLLMPITSRLMADGTGGVGADEFAEAAGAGFGMSAEAVEDFKNTLAAREVEVLRDGGDLWSELMPDHQDFAGLLAVVEAATDEDLAHATAAVVGTASLQLFAVLGSAVGLHQPGTEMPCVPRPDGVLAMLRHPVWHCWGQYQTPAGVNREDDVALWTALALGSHPVNVEALTLYAEFLRRELCFPSAETGE
ncbi:hypothetical protein [Kitasatospora sp. NPDC059327]|uniref:hypothetical protein n=1 Tax=Kitasatospora sp. NPDC059327 TaxID=3346803 RepID=UPI00367D1234